MPNISLSEDLVKAVLDLYEKKTPINDIVQITGVSVKSIYNIIKKHKIPHREVGFKSAPEAVADIIRRNSVEAKVPTALPKRSAPSNRRSSTSFAVTVTTEKFAATSSSTLCNASVLSTLA